MGRLLETLGRNSWRLVRWPIVSLILLAAAIGGLTGAFETCTTKTSQAGIETQCGPPGLSDVTVLVCALAVALLILPDLTEVGLLGISLKRRVEQAEKAVASEAQRVGELQTLLAVQQNRIDTLAFSQSVANSAANASLIVTPDALKVLQQGFDDKESAYLSGQQLPQSRVSAPIEDELAVLSAQLIARWEELRRILDAARPASDVGDLGSSRELERYQRFATIFAEEIQAVRATRNAVAHAVPVSAEDLERAIDVANRLLDTLSGDDPPDVDSQR